MILKILNGNNNYLSLNIDTMEEYDYFLKLWKMDEVIRAWNSFSHYGSPMMSKKVDGYPYITEMIEDRIVTNNNMDRYGRWTFSRFKAQRTRGDYKLSGWWDKFRTELYEINGAKSVTGYMINISPKWWWEGKVASGIIKHVIKHLEQCVIEFSKLSNRWKEFHYTIECGKEGNHPHAHIVCIPTDPKSTKAWIKKGNHSMTLRRIFDKPTPSRHEGFVGSLKGSENKRNYGAIQIVSINNFQLYKDKLEYLQEETKPPDHQNKYKVMDMKSIDFS